MISQLFGGSPKSSMFFSETCQNKLLRDRAPSFIMPQNIFHKMCNLRFYDWVHDCLFFLLPPYEHPTLLEELLPPCLIHSFVVLCVSECNVYYQLLSCFHCISQKVLNPELNNSLGPGFCYLKIPEVGMYIKPSAIIIIIIIKYRYKQSTTVFKA